MWKRTGAATPSIAAGDLRHVAARGHGRRRLPLALRKQAPRTPLWRQGGRCVWPVEPCLRVRAGVVHDCAFVAAPCPKAGAAPRGPRERRGTQFLDSLDGRKKCSPADGKKSPVSAGVQRVGPSSRLSCSGRTMTPAASACFRGASVSSTDDRGNGISGRHARFSYEQHQPRPVPRSLLDSASRQHETGPWGTQPPHHQTGNADTEPGAPPCRPPLTDGLPSRRELPHPLDKRPAISAVVS